MVLALASSVLLASVTVSNRARRSITGRPCAMIPASGNSACAAMVEHKKARTLIEAPLFNKKGFDKKRIHIPLLRPAKAKNEKAPGRRFLADQTPLSAWGAPKGSTEIGNGSPLTRTGISSGCFILGGSFF